MEISVWNTIYNTSGMSHPSKITTFWLTFGTFFTPFSRVPKKLLKKHLREACFKKSYHFRPTLGSRGGGHEVPFHIFFAHLGPFGPTWSPGDSGTPPNLHFSRFWERKSRCFFILGVKIVEILAESGDSFLLPKLKKKWRALRPVFLTLGEPFGRQSTSHSLLLQNSIKENGARSALYF